MTTVFDEEVTESTGSPLRSERYVLKLVRLEPQDHPQYGPGVRWVFHVMEPGSKAIVRQMDGDPYEYFQTTGTRLQAPKAGGKTAKSYKFACAFLGRPIQIGEQGSAIASAIVGKYAEAFLGPNDNGNLAIMAIDPIGTNYPEIAAMLKKSNNGAAPAAAPAPEPQPVAAGVSEELEF